MLDILVFTAIYNNIYRAPFVAHRTPSRPTYPFLSNTVTNTGERLHGVLLFGTVDSLNPRDTIWSEEFDGGLRIRQCIVIVQSADLETFSLTVRSAASNSYTLTILVPSKVPVSLHIVDPQSPLVFG